MSKKKNLKDMLSKMSQDDRIDFIIDEMDVLSGQIDAHRFVLAWIINQSFGTQGEAYLSCQANIFDEKKNKDHYHNAVVDEYDELRALVATVREQQ